MNKKKRIVILAIVLLAILIVIGGVIAILNTKGENKLYKTVVSVITLDINPSIKLELNKDNKVINMIALNEDAKDITLNNYEGNNLENVIDNITNKLIDKGYAKEKLVILVGVSGTITSNEVKELIDKKLTKDNIDYSVIIPEISDSSSKIAKEYNITESKAAYLEEIIKNNSNLKIEDIKDMSINDIVNKTNETAEDNANDNANENTNNGGGYGGGSKCDYVRPVLTNEEAGKKIANMMGATVGTGSYCDKLPPESVMVTTSDGNCNYKVTFKYRARKCVYYINVETGSIIGNPECEATLVEEGEAQCIIMESMGITKREQSGIKAGSDNGNEYIYEVEDLYGTPDENGQRYVYEYHVSKTTGQITAKNKIGILN